MDWEEVANVTHRATNPEQRKRELEQICVAVAKVVKEDMI